MSSSSLHIDQLLHQLAAAHDGLIPTDAIVAAGHSREALARRVKINALLWVRRGVRATVGTQLTPTRHAMAAALLNPGSWVSHTAALDVYGATLKPSSLRAEISGPDQQRLANVHTHQTDGPGQANLGCRFGVSISQPWWAIVEASAVLPEDLLAVAMDSLVQSKLTSLARLQRAHEEAGRYRGRPLLARLLDDRLNGQGLVNGFLEQDLDRALRKCGLPVPVRNFTVRLPNGKIRVIDRAWPNVKLGVEAHSWQYHSNTTDWGRTMIRDRELTSIGWTMFPVVVADVRDPTSLLVALKPLLDSAVARR